MPKRLPATQAELRGDVHQVGRAPTLSPESGDKDGAPGGFR
jgi:hypothetical protein